MQETASNLYEDGNSRKNPYAYNEIDSYSFQGSKLGEAYAKNNPTQIYSQWRPRGYSYAPTNLGDEADSKYETAANQILSIYSQSGVGNDIDATNQFIMDTLMAWAVNKSYREVAANHDYYSMMFTGTKMESKSFGEAFVKSWRTDGLNRKIAKLQRKIDATDDTDSIKMYESRIANLEKEMVKSGDYRDRGFAANTLIESAPIINQVVRAASIVGGTMAVGYLAGAANLLQGGGKGAKALALALKGARLNGTVNKAQKAGAAINMLDTFLVESGSLSHELYGLTDSSGAQIPKNARMLAAYGYGIIATAIEYGTAEVFWDKFIKAKSPKGTEDVIKSSYMKFIRGHFLTNYIYKNVRGGLSESFEEFMQSAVSSMATDIAKNYSDSTGTTHFGKTPVVDVVANALNSGIDAFVQALGPSIVAGAVPNIPDVIMDSNIIRKKYPKETYAAMTEEQFNDEMRPLFMDGGKDLEAMRKSAEAFQAVPAGATIVDIDRINVKNEAPKSDYGKAKEDGTPADKIGVIDVEMDPKDYGQYVGVTDEDNDKLKWLFNKGAEGVAVRVHERIDTVTTADDLKNLESQYNGKLNGDTFVVDSEEELNRLKTDLTAQGIKVDSKNNTFMYKPSATEAFATVKLQTKDQQKSNTIVKNSNGVIKNADFVTSLRTALTNNGKTNTIVTDGELQVIANLAGMFGNDVTGKIDFLSEHDQSLTEKETSALKGARGITSFREDLEKSARIILSDTADGTTIVHEMFHVALKYNEEARKKLVKSFKKQLTIPKGVSELKTYLAEHPQEMKSAGFKSVDEMVEALSKISNDNAVRNARTNEALTAMWEMFNSSDNAAKQAMPSSVKAIFAELMDMFKRIYRTITGKTLMPERIANAYAGFLNTNGSINTVKSEGISQILKQNDITLEQFFKDLSDKSKYIRYKDTNVWIDPNRLELLSKGKKDKRDNLLEEIKSATAFSKNFNKEVFLLRDPLWEKYYVITDRKNPDAIADMRILEIKNIVGGGNALRKQIGIAVSQKADIIYCNIDKQSELSKTYESVLKGKANKSNNLNNKIVVISVDRDNFKSFLIKEKESLVIDSPWSAGVLNALLRSSNQNKSDNQNITQAQSTVNNENQILQQQELDDDYIDEWEETEKRLRADPSNFSNDEERFILAPDGEPSNLDYRQWVQVRTPRFIKWFGDWLNDPEHSSKVLDWHGEPLVVYHGTRTGGFDVFDNKGRNWSTAPRGSFWFSDNILTARSYSGSSDSIHDFSGPTIDYDENGNEITTYNYQKGIYECFLNIRNPYIANFEGQYWNGGINSYGKYGLVYKNNEGEVVNAFNKGGRRLFTMAEIDEYAKEHGLKKGYFQDVWQNDNYCAPVDDIGLNTNDIAKEVKAKGTYDGIIFKDIKDGGDYGKSSIGDDYIAFKPNQIKSALFNNGGFSPYENSILKQEDIFQGEEDYESEQYDTYSDEEDAILQQEDISDDDIDGGSKKPKKKLLSPATINGLNKRLQDYSVSDLEVLSENNIYIPTSLLNRKTSRTSQYSGELQEELAIRGMIKRIVTDEEKQTAKLSPNLRSFIEKMRAEHESNWNDLKERAYTKYYMYSKVQTPSEMRKQFIDEHKTLSQLLSLKETMTMRRIYYRDHETGQMIGRLYVPRSSFVYKEIAGLTKDSPEAVVNNIRASIEKHTNAWVKAYIKSKRDFEKINAVTTGNKTADEAKLGSERWLEATAEIGYLAFGDLDFAYAEKQRLASLSGENELSSETRLLNEQSYAQDYVESAKSSLVPELRTFADRVEARFEDAISMIKMKDQKKYKRLSESADRKIEKVKGKYEERLKRANDNYHDLRDEMDEKLWRSNYRRRKELAEQKKKLQAEKKRDLRLTKALDKIEAEEKALEAKEKALKDKYDAVTRERRKAEISKKNIRNLYDQRLADINYYRNVALREAREKSKYKLKDELSEQRKKFQEKERRDIRRIRRLDKLMLDKKWNTKYSEKVAALKLGRSLSEAQIKEYYQERIRKLRNNYQRRIQTEKTDRKIKKGLNVNLANYDYSIVDVSSYLYDCINDRAKKSLFRIDSFEYDSLKTKRGTVDASEGTVTFYEMTTDKDGNYIVDENSQFDLEMGETKYDRADIPQQLKQYLSSDTIKELSDTSKTWANISLEAKLNIAEAQDMARADAKVEMANKKAERANVQNRMAKEAIADVLKCDVELSDEMLESIAGEMGEDFGKISQDPDELETFRRRAEKFFRKNNGMLPKEEIGKFRKAIGKATQIYGAFPRFAKLMGDNVYKHFVEEPQKALDNRKANITRRNESGDEEFNRILSDGKGKNKKGNYTHDNEKMGWLKEQYEVGSESGKDKGGKTKLSGWNMVGAYMYSKNIHGFIKLISRYGNDIAIEEIAKINPESTLEFLEEEFKQRQEFNEHELKREMWAMDRGQTFKAKSLSSFLADYSEQRLRTVWAELKAQEASGQMKSSLPTYATELGDKIIELLGKETARVENVAYSMYNSPFKLQSSYVPLYGRDSAHRDKAIGGISIKADRVYKGMIADRSMASDYALMLEPVTVYKNAVQEQENFINMTQVVNDLNYMMDEHGGNLYRLISNQYGSDLANVFEKQIETLAFSKSPLLGYETLGNKLVANASSAAVAFNLPSIVKNFVSDITSLSEGDFKAKDMLFAIKELSVNREYWESKYKALAPDIANSTFSFDYQMLKDSNSLDRYGENKEKVMEAGMKGLEWADRKAKMIAWIASFQNGLDSGMGEQDAAVKATLLVKRTQSVSNPDALSIVQRSYNPWTRMVFAFTKDTFQIWNQLTMGVANDYKRGDYMKIVEKAVGALLSAAVMAALAGGWTPDKDDDDFEPVEFFRDWVAQLAEYVPVAGTGIKAGMDGWDSDLITLPNEIGSLFAMPFNKKDYTWDEYAKQIFDVIGAGTTAVGVPVNALNKVKKSVFADGEKDGIRLDPGYLYSNDLGDWMYNLELQDLIDTL